MKRRLDFAVATVAYALVWIATRWPAIRANTLFFDDFEIPFRPADFYWGPYRPTLYLEFLLRDLIAPHAFWTVVPKLFGALYVGVMAALLIELLTAWDVPLQVARLLPLIVVAHPLLADGPLWQTYAGLPIVPALITAGALAWTRGRKLAFALLTLAGVLGYQVFVTLALVYAVAEPVVRRRWRWRELVERVAIIAGCVVVQLVLTAIIRRTYGNPDPRGMIGVFDPRTQLHGAVDLIVNVWMPVIAFYTGALRAMSLWKWVPLAIAAATAVSTRRILPTFFSAAIFLIPALPNLLIAQGPSTWRVSIPELFALVVALVPLFSRFPRAGVIVTVAIFAVIAPVSTYEARCRVDSFDRDRQLVASVPPGDAVVLAPVNPKHAEDVSLIGPHDLTWAYERRTPRMWSEFNDPWFANRYVTNYWHLPFVDCLATPADARCSGTAALCATGRDDGPVVYPRTIRDDARRITIVCPSQMSLREKPLQP